MNGYHLWQQCQWPPAQQQDVAAVDLAQLWWRVRDRSHPAEKAWYPLGEQELLVLLTEVERLQAQLVTAQAERGEERRNASRLFDDLRAQVESLLTHQRHIGGVYADLMKAYETLEAQVEELNRILHEERGSFSIRLADAQLRAKHAEAQVEAMRDVVEAAREYCSNITWNRGPLKEAMARLDEQPGTSEQTPQQGQQPASDKSDALADSQPDGAAADQHSAP